MGRGALIVMVAFVLLTGGGARTVHAENLPQAEEPAIQPETTEHEMKEAKIDTESLELGAFYGLYGMEGFGASGVYGFRLAYHLTEDVFFEGTYAATRFDQSTFQQLTGRSLVADDQVVYWNVDAGYNLFPGQIFLTRRKTINSTIFLIGGLGQTRVDQQDQFTFNAGTGFKLYITDWLDIRLDFRLHAFESDLTGKNEMTYNLEDTASIGFFF
jgi:outer membrane beta-barrel protein